MGAAAVFVAFQLAFCTMLALHLGFYAVPPFEKYGWAAAAPPMFYAAGLACWHLRAMPDRPFRHLAEQDWQGPIRFAAAMVLIWLQFVSLTWAKAMIPLATPMWADPMLAHMESALLGRDAWRYLPEPSQLILIPYALWPFAIGAAYAFSYFRRDGQEMLAFFLTVGLLGTLGQFVLPSGGPVFYERLGFGDRFADMPVHGAIERATAYLWAAYQGQYMNFATGISAFPSIHVATSMWLALALRNWIGWTYLAVIFAGSIILGWHYAIDGIAGMVGAAACYPLAKAILAIHFAVPVRNAA